MKIIKDIKEIRAFSEGTVKKGKKIGFVPTMGYLHKGHESLINAARADNDVVIVSIFVNPAQFGPDEDFNKYPRDFKRDERIAANCGADIIFYPDKDDIYPKGYSTFVEVIGIEDNLCGPSRPGHFRGVATVVAKLFNIIGPDTAYFGQKDAQQAAIVKRMVRDLDMNILIKVMPIVREDNGLAISSRNVYLSDGEAADASILFEALTEAKAMFESGEKESAVIIRRIKEMIGAKNSAKTDYVKIVDVDNMNDIEIIGEKALVALAVFFGKTRLIDNIIIGG